MMTPPKRGLSGMSLVWTLSSTRRQWAPSWVVNAAAPAMESRVGPKSQARSVNVPVRRATREAARGFPLLGGRLDYVGGRPVAALVYGRRLHRINVFVWPDRGGSGGVGRAERNGYYLERWSLDGMRFWAVSDLNRPELEGFVRLLQRADTSKASP